MYKAVREHRPVSRAQLARLLGISKPTAARVVAQLVAKGLIRPAASPGEGRSFGAEFVELSPRVAAGLVIDTVGRQLRGELIDLDGVRLARADGPPVRPVAGPGAPDPAVVITRLCGELVRSARLRPGRLVRAVVGLAEADPAMIARLGAALGVPVRAELDVHLAALGEQRRGAGGGAPDFVLLSVGQDVRAGIVLGGALYRGGNGAAGLVDYVPGGRGFSTDSPAAEAFLAFAEQRVRLAGAATALRPPLRIDKVFAAARSGDRLAGELVAGEARRIARYAARLAGVLDPKVLALGGGIGANGDLLLDPVRRSLAGLLPVAPQVVTARLGDAATLAGAAVLAVEDAIETLLTSPESGRQP